MYVCCMCVCMYIVGIYKLYNHRFFFLRKTNCATKKCLFLLLLLLLLFEFVFFLFLCIFFFIVFFICFLCMTVCKGCVGSGGREGVAEVGYKLRLCRSKLMRGTCVECLFDILFT